MDQNDTTTTTTTVATAGTTIIRRYNNRKLYDTQESKYTTLTNIKAMVAAGQTVQVVDNETQADVTGATLLKAIIETESDIANQTETLRDVILAGGLTKYVAGLKGKPTA